MIECQSNLAYDLNVNIVLLGSVNPHDFDLGNQDLEKIQGLSFRRSVPVSDLAMTLIEFGHNVTVLGIAKTLEPELSLRTQNGLKLIYVRGRNKEKIKALTFYSVERQALLTQIALIKPDVIHAHWTYEYALTAQDSGLPYVITVHDDPWGIFLGFRNFYFFLRLLIAIRVRVRATTADNFVFVSGYMRSLWHQRMFATGGLVIPNMNRLVKTKSSRSQKAETVISVGNPDRRKNIRGLLAAWEMALVVNPNLRLHLVGPGLGEKDRLAQKYNHRFEVGQVTWHGSLNRTELKTLYSSCDVLVHPSQRESFGLIFLEAFAFDLGVIALAQSGSVFEVVGDAGLIIEDGTKESLCDAILRLTSNQTLIDQLTENGRLRLKFYSPDRITAMYISLYEKVSRNK